MSNYIYFLCDPRDRVVRYVGKTENPEVRLRTHVNHCYDSITKRNCWIRGLLQEGIKPEMVVFFEVPILKSHELYERFFIAAAKTFGFNLTNMAEGGLGGQSSEVVKASWAKREVWENRSAAMRKAFARPEVKAKISASLKLAFSTPEERVRRSEHSSSQWQNPQVRKDLVEAMRAPGVQARRVASRIANENLQVLGPKSHSVWIEHEGKRLYIAAWARRAGITPSCLRWRLRNGWSTEQALAASAEQRFAKFHRMVDGVHERQCSICEKWLPFTDAYFRRYKNGQLHGQCRSCSRVYRHIYYRSHAQERASA